MAERSNFLIGYGERLASDMAAPLAGCSEAPSLYFRRGAGAPCAQGERDGARAGRLPRIVCPGDQTVALVTLHPTYLAKSYYPASFSNLWA